MNFFSFFRRKRVIWPVVIFLALGGGWWLLFGHRSGQSGIQTAKVTRQDLQQTVLTTGQVVSKTDLQLSFQSSGKVTSVRVQEGDKVSRGQVLATLDESSALAQLQQAQGALAQAQANYESVAAGSTPEAIKVSEDAVASASQDLSNEYLGAPATFTAAYTKMYNAVTLVSRLQSDYFSANDTQGLKVQQAKNSMDGALADAKTQIQVAGSQDAVDASAVVLSNDLQSMYSALSAIREQCDSGQYYSRVSSADKTDVDDAKADMTTELSDISAFQQDAASYKVALQKAQDQLAQTKAPATQADIDAAKAQIASAQGQVASAQATLNNLIITAPDAGTVTQVNVKLGEQAQALADAVDLQNVAALHAEANVSEANIAAIQPGQSVDYTFDALGPDRHFAGKVLTVNPASTVISGVVNYLVKGSLDNIPGIKPGMTANMTILTAKRSQALAVPASAAINKSDGQYVRVVDNAKVGTYHEVKVTTGLQADGGLIEILSGLQEGQTVVTYVKQ